MAKDSLNKGYFTCETQSCKGKFFTTETAYWPHLNAKTKSFMRGHPSAELLKKWCDEFDHKPFVPSVDPNWISGLEQERQEKAQVRG